MQPKFSGERATTLYRLSTFSCSIPVVARAFTNAQRRIGSRSLLKFRYGNFPGPPFRVSKRCEHRSISYCPPVLLGGILYLIYICKTFSVNQFCGGSLKSSYLRNISAFEIIQGAIQILMEVGDTTN
jgi:hypothetical protein